MTDPGVTYTVKEMLERMENRADERHQENQRMFVRMENRVDGLIRERIEPLEKDSARRTGATETRKAMWILATGSFGALCSLPSILVLFR